MACASFVKLNAPSWIGQQSSARRPSRSSTRRVSFSIRATAYTDELVQTAKSVASPGRGILAIDESNATCGKRLASIGLDNTETNRQAYRQLLLTTPGLGEYISGAILFEETLYQSTADGKKFVDCLRDENIVPGIKVDKGLVPLPGSNNESWCQGLDGLASRSAEYYKQGARFAKWRTVVSIPCGPSALAVKEAAWGLARYASISQDNGLVPIVEPEILLDGDHSIERTLAVAEKVWAEVFFYLAQNNVVFEGILLKPSMVTPGAEHKEKASPETIAKYTLTMLKRRVPPAVPGIMFLSGGQSEVEATLNLNAMNQSPNPWHVSFSYARALQNTVLKTWQGRPENVEAAQRSLLIRAKANSLAQLGKYSAEGESEEAKKGIGQAYVTKIPVRATLFTLWRILGSDHKFRLEKRRRFILRIACAPLLPSSSPLSLRRLPPSSPPPLESLKPSLSMKDRPPPSSYGSVYVPPHCRLRSVFVAPSHNSPSPVAAPSATGSKPRDTQAVVPLNPRHHPPRPSPSPRPQEQQKFVSAYDDGVLEEGSDREMELASAAQHGAAWDNVDEWKRKLNMLLRDKGKQELVSREKKDRRDFDRIAALAAQLGLYSHSYGKAVVFSKVPLPNYRFDLDEKRPLREVSLPLGLMRRVETYLGDYLFHKSKTKRDFPATFSRSSSGSLSTDDGLFEQPEPLASSNAVIEKILSRRSMQLLDQQKAWQESPEGKKMLEFRRSLPAYRQKDAILSAISQDQVVIISGETGCGKTTQIPQFILESEIESCRGALCSVICTQPRRISAISVSERVASERGESLGESVGYKVRLEGVRGKDTHLLFCTTGILLRRLLVDRNLRGITHVIVDEIHERGMNEEMTGYKLTPYNQIDDYGQEKAWRMNKQAPRKRKSQIASAVEDALSATNFKEYGPQTQDSLSCWNPDCLGFNLIEHLLCQICENERRGAVLVFVTGWDDISALKDKLQAHPILGDPSRVLLLTCHGSMASSEQRLIFDKAEEGVRKIVLATNIAETSITINDVVFVLDCGKAKETSYDALNNTPCLLPSWISKVSAQQVQNAIEYLQVIGALDENENLTALGRYLTLLPMEPKLGKMLILGAILNCLDPILTVVAGLSVRDPFLTPMDKKDLADAAKSQFSRGQSDHLALIRAYEGWKDAERDLTGYEYCWKNFLSAQSMKAIDSLRKEFLLLLKDTDLVDGNITTCNTWSHDEHLIRAVICYGLYPGICSVVNSANARESKIAYPWLIFNEKIKVNAVFLRDSTAVSDSMLLLFGGSVSKGETLLNPRMDVHLHHELLSAVRILLSEDKGDGRFVFGHQVLKSSKPSVMPKPTLISRTESGPGGDNSKSQLQTLVTRAGYAAPSYKTKQLQNGHFQATVEFNGMQIMGQPCNNKKSAEKDAAAEALQWLMGGTQTGREYINHMSMLLKKSKKDHH
ncbi:hypothetical protein Tsubulata_018727 [Turnera subulata]|uniref:Fructose-bisphosphate aldolase n=2 Tax=Magnoliopsida TaxID=3398 RepID=A0A9Q0GEY4_9ROSI|nr:hypothetical protein Tsubulata_018727 [Turnera subulata]